MKAYKITDKNGACKGYQYEVGKTYFHVGEIKLCAAGFHACVNPMDCQRYHDIFQARFFEVEMGGKIETGEDKIVSSQITFVRELSLAEYIDECIKYADNNTTTQSTSASKKDHAQLVASGYCSKLVASGESSKLVASGSWSKLVASGESSQLTASGDRSKLTASGDYSIAASFGNFSKIKIDKPTSWLVITDYNPNGEVRAVYAKRPGQKLKGVTIKTGYWYWFEDGKLKEKSCEERDQND